MLENHVPSLELCKKWKELGGGQDTELFFGLTHDEDNPAWEIYTKRQKEKLIPRIVDEWVATPLASEMMEWIGDMNLIKKNNVYDLTQPTSKHFVISFDSLPNALMQMCISRK